MGRGWGDGSGKAGTMKGEEQGNGEGGRGVRWEEHPYGYSGGWGRGEFHRGYRGRGKQNMYGMTACASTIGKKGQIDDLTDEKWCQKGIQG